jgi:hypothetical protein
VTPDGTFDKLGEGIASIRAHMGPDNLRQCAECDTIKHMKTRMETAMHVIRKKLRVGAGRGVFGSTLEVDQHIRRERDAWQA